MTKRRLVLLGTIAVAAICIAILWSNALRKPLPPPVGSLSISSVHRTTGLDGSVSCSFTVSNPTNRRLAVRAMLERLRGDGQWVVIPCSRPGPMYATDLLLLDSGKTNSVVLPLPANDPSGVNYRIGVNCWACEPSVRVWQHDLRSALYSVLGRKAPDSGLGVIKGIGEPRATAIYWPARLRINTQVWEGVQPGAPPNGGPATRPQNSAASDRPPSVS